MIQRVTIAKIAGAASRHIAARFAHWIGDGRDSKFPAALPQEVDRFAEALRANPVPPVVYFAEWIDMWSMGDVIPSLGTIGAAVVAGKRFEASCHRLPVTLSAPTFAGETPQEIEWLAARLREAEVAWVELAPDAVLVVLREMLGGTILDSELTKSLTTLPRWLNETNSNQANGNPCNES
jgi:hypothetical protein